MKKKVFKLEIVPVENAVELRSRQVLPNLEQIYSGIKPNDQWYLSFDGHMKGSNRLT